MPTFEEEKQLLYDNAVTRMTLLHERYRNSPAKGRDGPASVEERAIDRELTMQLMELGKKYGRDTV